MIMKSMKLNLYLPIQKGAFQTGVYEKISETDSVGNPRTRYKIWGTASTAALDKDNEIVSPICLKKMEAQINRKRLPIFGNHEHKWEDMIGYTNEAVNKDDLLKIAILTDFVETNPKVNQLIGKLDANLPLMLSIGGKVTQDHSVKNKDGKQSRVLDDVTLYETSVVGIGANPDAFLSLPEQISKFMKQMEPGNLPKKAKEILRRVYAKARKEGYSKERAAKIAWGAVNRAGYETGKTLKEEVDLPANEFVDEIIAEVEKSAGQLGMASYGKLGETTPESNCPRCGLPAELRMIDDRISHYHCGNCNLAFDVGLPTKQTTSIPYNNPVNPPVETIDRQTQSVLGRKDAKLEGDIMAKKKKEGEAEAEARCKDAEAEGEAEGEAEDETDAETEYKRFVSHMERYKKETTKAEGVTTPPGGENANPKYNIGGSGGAATPVHAKSVQTFESMKKHFSEEAGAEASIPTKEGTISLKFQDLKRMLRK